MIHFGTWIWQRGKGWSHVTSLSGGRWGLGVAIETRGSLGIEIELLVVAFVINLGRGANG